MLHRSAHSAASRPVEERGWRDHGAAVSAQGGELAALQAENARLIALLESHGIQWRRPQPVVQVARETEPSKLSTAEKVALFRRLFRGRTDVYPIRWEGKTSGKTGYAPACANEWRAGVCEKPRIKCGDCSNRLLIPLSDAVIYDHLAGEHTVGVYPLLEDDSCFFLAVDFDEAEWRDDALAFLKSCDELGVPVALEISRSGNGAHAWVFFASRVSARDARRLGAAIITHTCARTRQLKLESYDRLFPNQDTMPKGGFGNLIALPLQKGPREQGFSVFVDPDLRPYPDQWAFLASIQLAEGSWRAQHACIVGEQSCNSGFLIEAQTADKRHVQRLATEAFISQATGNAVISQQRQRGIQTTARQGDVLGIALGTTDDAWFVPHRHPHRLGLVELRVLESRQPDQPVGQSLRQLGLLEIDQIGQRDGQ
jgi:hypothetical protein